MTILWRLSPRCVALESYSSPMQSAVLYRVRPIALPPSPNHHECDPTQGIARILQGCSHFSHIHYMHNLRPTVQLSLINHKGN